MSITREWEHNGLRCHTRFHERMDTWCGYVAVPDDHPWSGKGYDDEVDGDPVELLGMDINEACEDFGAVHVLSMALSDGPIHPTPATLLRVHGGVTFAGKWSGDGPWVFGFDCAHAGDEDRGWDQETVSAETNRLAEQLAKIVSTDGES